MCKFAFAFMRSFLDIFFSSSFYDRWIYYHYRSARAVGHKIKKIRRSQKFSSHSLPFLSSPLSLSPPPHSPFFHYDKMNEEEKKCRWIGGMWGEGDEI